MYDDHHQLGLEITVGKAALLKKLFANKARFVKSYDALVQAYTEKVVIYKKEFAEHAQKVADGTVEEDTERPMPPMEPVNRTKDYDWYINMIQSHTEKHIRLNEASFASLWNDQWEWTAQHHRALLYFADANVSGAKYLASMASNYAGS